MTDDDRQRARACLVESIPKGLEDLRGTPGIAYTEDVLVRLTRAAKHSIDLTAMYWSLVPDPEGADEKGFTSEQFEAMGAGTGEALLTALRDAAERGVHIRIVESPGFSGGVPESAALALEFPDRVEIRSIDMGKWYGGSGIMHQKIWIFDSRHIYLGSANMDWKSIMQVKEMGVVVEDAAALAMDTTTYFQTWWDFCALTPASAVVFDPAVRIDRRVPAWSQLVPEAERAQSPFDDEAHRTGYNHKDPLVLPLDGEPGRCFLSGCPREVRGRGRTFDGSGLVYTIDDARRSVSVSVMDFAPVGLYARKDPGTPPGDEAPSPIDAPVWWPLLADALLSAVLTRRLHVRLLVSKWAHTSRMVEPFLRALQSAADAGRSDKVLTAGQLEIKLFIIPGWDDTSAERRRYPGHTRVNHTKYIVTDRRINIGTSNMTWDYFASTAGASFNADHPTLVRTLQSVFDRDWASRYAFRLT